MTVRSLILFSLPSSLSLFGQSFTASIRGVAVDPSQAVIPGGTIAATGVERNLKYSTRTDENGRWVLLSLPPGN